MTLLIDGDACPVKTEAIRVAERYRVPVTLISNSGHRPIPGVRQIVVGAEFDAADNWIVENASPGDIVLTTDIKLAARCIEKNCKVLNPTGHIYTNQNIGSALASRELNAYLREAGEIKGGNAAFSKQDRSRFLQSLDRLMQPA